MLVIDSFGDDSTQDIFDGVNSKAARKISISLWPVVNRKLDMVNAAQELRDLAAPSGNRLQALKGKLKGMHSIRVNDQYRITFRWEAGNAYEVRVTDYH
jgi:proteic killer suppression protein